MNLKNIYKFENTRNFSSLAHRGNFSPRSLRATWNIQKKCSESIWIFHSELPSQKSIVKMSSNWQAEIFHCCQRAQSKKPPSIKIIYTTECWDSRCSRHNWPWKCLSVVKWISEEFSRTPQKKFKRENVKRKSNIKSFLISLCWLEMLAVLVRDLNYKFTQKIFANIFYQIFSDLSLLIVRQQ